MIRSHTRCRGQGDRQTEGRFLSLGALRLGLGLSLLGGAVCPVNAAVPAEWRQMDNSLVTVCEFADFATAVAFVNRLVEPADRLGHHPDIAIAYNRLTLSLTTHDAGGVTDLDVTLAKIISALQTGQCQFPS